MSILLPYQQRFFAAEAKLRVVEKSRRVGITWSEAARQVLLASLSRSEGGRNCYYLSTSGKLGKDYIATCAEWVRTLGLASKALGESMVDKDGCQIEQIVFKSGFKIQALTSNAESMRGKGGDLIIDEAAHHMHLEDLLVAANALGDWGGNLTLISTHNGANNPFAKVVEEVRTGERKGILHTITILDALEQGLHKRKCQLEGKPWSQELEDEWLEDTRARGWNFEQEYLVIPSAQGTTFLRKDLIEQNSAPATVLRIDRPSDHFTSKTKETRMAEVDAWIKSSLNYVVRGIPQDRTTTIGVDFARSHKGDLSVFALLTEQRNLKKTCPLLLEMRGVPYDESWEMLKRIGEGLGSGFGGVSLDAKGNGHWLSEQAVSQWGNRVTQVDLSKSWYAENLPRFRNAFEEGQITVPLDSDVRDDLMMFEVHNGSPRMSIARRADSKDRKPRHGDAGMALALAFSQHSKAPPKMEFRRPGEQNRRPGVKHKYEF